MTSSQIETYHLTDEPEMVSFVRMAGSDEMYHVCRQDGYGMLPWTDGLGQEVKISDCVMSKKQVLEKFGIELDI